MIRSEESRKAFGASADNMRSFEYLEGFRRHLASLLSKDAIHTSADALMHPYDHLETEVEQLDSVVSATIICSGERAVTVEQVSELD
jgi:hypothetical protein